MIQKSLIIVAFIFSIVNFASAAVVRIDWNNTNQDQLSELAKSSTNDIDKKTYNTLLSLKDLSAQNMSYEQFKGLLKKQNMWVPQFTVCINRFNAFKVNVCKDPEYNKHPYTLAYIAPHILSSSEWRDLVMSSSEVQITNRSDFAMLILKEYAKYMINVEDINLVKSDLAKFKRMWYSNLTKSDQWKEVVVYIELLIKSVQ